MSPQNPEMHLNASAPAFQRQRRLMTLGLLSPVIQKFIVRGEQFSVITLIRLPLAWSDQTTFFKSSGLC